VEKILISRIHKSEFDTDVNLYNKLVSLVIENWGDPGESFLKKSLEDADVIFVAKQGSKICAFVTGDYVDRDILFLHFTVVSADCRGRGLYRKMNSKIIFDFMKKHKFQALKGFFVVFRTANPSLYERVYKYLPLFPDYKKVRSPNSKEIEIFEKISQLTSPQSEKNTNDFVIMEAYADSPGLILKPEKIPYAFEKDINDFFEEKLALTKQEGNVMVCLGRVSLYEIFKYIKRTR